MATSPSTANLYIGAGTAYFKATGETYFTDLGECKSFSVVTASETKDHFTKRTATRTKDLSIVSSQTMTVRITLEEWSPYNLRVALLGTLSTSTDGNQSINIFTATAVTGVVRFVGINGQGTKQEVILNNVSFAPGTTLELLDDDFGSFELVGEALIDANSAFGTWDIVE